LPLIFGGVILSKWRTAPTVPAATDWREEPYRRRTHQRTNPGFALDLSFQQRCWERML